MGSHLRIVHVSWLGHDKRPLLNFIAAERGELNRDREGAARLAAQLATRDETYLALDLSRGQDYVVGIVALSRGEKPSDEHIAQLRIHLREEYRANGLGSLMLLHALEFADDVGIQRVVATPYMLGDWHAKVRFFERHGFRFEGTARHGARLLDGTLVWTITLGRTTAAT